MDAVSLVAPVRDRVTALLDSDDDEVRRALRCLRVVIDRVRAGGWRGRRSMLPQLRTLVRRATSGAACLHGACERSEALSR